MSLKKQLKEHDKKIELYNNKIQKYKRLIDEENDNFEPIQKKLSERQHKKYLDNIVKKCKDSYVFMMESVDRNDLDELLRLDIKYQILNINVFFRGSHRLDDDHHLESDSMKINVSSCRITYCPYSEIKSSLEEYIGNIDGNLLMDKLKYEVDSLVHGYWGGTLEIYVLGKFEPQSVDK